MFQLDGRAEGKCRVWSRVCMRSGDDVVGSKIGGQLEESTRRADMDYIRHILKKNVP